MGYENKDKLFNIPNVYHFWTETLKTFLYLYVHNFLPLATDCLLGAVSLEAKSHILFAAYT